MMNIILIGMPGCGKSTAGVLLAKSLCKDFVDTDLIIQQAKGDSLQNIINKKGHGYFLKCEEETLLNFSAENAVVATGGSVVYSENIMNRLKRQGKIVYLSISFDTMKRRVRNIRTRGIVMKPGQTLEDLYKERLELYQKYADITIDCDKMTPERTVRKIIDCLK